MLLYHHVMRKNYELVRVFTRQKRYKTALLSSIICVFLLQSAKAQGIQNILTVPSASLATGFKGTGNFNAIIFGDFTSNSGDVEGRLVVGGNFHFKGSGYSVGSAGSGAVNAPDDTDNFIVNGNFNNAGHNWGIRGNFIYNTATAGISFPSHQSGSTTSGVTEHVKFANGALLTKYKQLSATLTNNAVTGEVTQPYIWSPILLKGTNSGLNVFELTLPVPFNSGSIHIDIPSGATALINVTNSTVSIDGGSMKMIINGSEDGSLGAAPKVLFNFRHATQINLARYAFLGSVLAPNANLEGDGGSINGQAIIGGNFNQLGGFEFHNFSFAGGFDSPLPVTLVAFKAMREGGSVALSWITTAETNSSHFDIERSANGKNWQAIGTVASAGESTISKNYHFTDSSPVKGQNLYRLKMVDFPADGPGESFAYSRIQSVTMDGISAIRVYPNPAAETIMLDNLSDVKGVMLTSQSGHQVYRSQSIDATGIDCRNMVSGKYVLTITRNNGSIDAHHVLIQK